jgi:hypothetical protein
MLDNAAYDNLPANQTLSSRSPTSRASIAKRLSCLSRFYDYATPSCSSTRRSRMFASAGTW